MLTKCIEFFWFLVYLILKMKTCNITLASITFKQLVLTKEYFISQEFKIGFVNTNW